METGIGSVIVFILIGALFIAGFFIQSYGASNGQHTGFVTSVEYNSNIIFGANIVYFKTNTMSSQEDRYCVNDLNLKAKLEQYAKDNTEVTIKYKNDFFMWKWDCNGGETIIYDVIKK